MTIFTPVMPLNKHTFFINIIYAVVAYNHVSISRNSILLEYD